MSVTPPLAYCEHGYCESEHCRTCEIMGVCKPCERASAAQGRDGRKDHQRRTGNDPHGPTGRAAGTYTPSAASSDVMKAITNALYALNPNQGERPDPSAAAMWLRTTLPEDHPNFLTWEAVETLLGRGYVR